MEEESENNLHKTLNSRFSRSHFEIGGLATARTELGVSIYLGHMLAEDVWVRHFHGGKIEAIIYDFEEPRVREERFHQCWGWSAELHEKGLLLRLDGSRSELATFWKVCTPCLHCRKAGKAKGHRRDGRQRLEVKLKELRGALVAERSLHFGGEDRELRYGGDKSERFEYEGG